MKTAKQHLPTTEQIAAHAYEIYLQRGSQPGREQDDWLQAEYEFMRLPARKLAVLKTTSVRNERSQNALVSLVQAAMILGSTLTE